MSECRPVAIPLPEGLTLSAETNTKEVNSTYYCKLVGRLIYLTNTRPDLSFSVGLISRFMQAPQQAHLDAAMHIVRYISSTTDFGIFYKKNGTLQLQGFTDADWGNACPDTRRSTGGYVYKLSDGPITWSSKRQPTVSRSTTEAEYKALSEGAQEGVYLKRLLDELQQTVTTTPQLFCNAIEVTSNLQGAEIPTMQDLHLRCDNVSAIKLAKNPVFHSRTKHLEIHHHFIRERILENELSVTHVDTDLQEADIFTKVLTKRKFERNRVQIGMRSISALDHTTH